MPDILRDVRATDAMTQGFWPSVLRVGLPYPRVRVRATTSAVKSSITTKRETRFFPNRFLQGLFFFTILDNTSENQMITIKLLRTLKGIDFGECETVGTVNVSWHCKCL